MLVVAEEASAGGWGKGLGHVDAHALRQQVPGCRVVAAFVQCSAAVEPPLCLLGRPPASGPVRQTKSAAK